MTHEKIAQDLLFPLWRCVNEDFKTKYKADAWGIFFYFLKTAACNESLPIFFEKLKRLIPMTWQHQYEKIILETLRSGEDVAVLDKLRNECSYLVLLTRELNTQRKEIFKTNDSLHLFDNE